MAKGEIHIITKDRLNGEVLWDSVWCASCVRKHKAIFGADATLKITETPWTGDARACDSCDDSELAPEFKFSKVAPALALLVALLLPSFAQAQTAPIIVGNALDLVSTEVVIARGVGREANPLVGNHVAQRVAVKAAGTALQVFLVKKIEQRGHPKLAKVVGYSAGAFYGVVAARNLRVGK